MRPDRVSMLCRVGDGLLSFMAQPMLRCHGGSVGFVQLSRAILTANLHGIAADRDLDRIGIQLAIASRAGSLNHDVILPEHPKSGWGEWTMQREPAAIRIFSDFAGDSTP